MPHAKAADGTRIAYQTGGDGPSLLLLTGQADNHHWRDGIRTDFETAYRTISFDYRGTGDSDKPDIPYSTLGFAEDLDANVRSPSSPGAQANSDSSG